jgi:hypothetical protein
MEPPDSRTRLQDLHPALLRHIARLCDGNTTVLCLRPAAHAICEALRDCTTVRLSEPVPEWAFAAKWSQPEAVAALTIHERGRLACYVASRGDLASLRLLLVAPSGPRDVGPLACTPPLVVLEAAAAAGQLAVLQFLRAAFGCWSPLAASLAAYHGHADACMWAVAASKASEPSTADEAQGPGQQAPEQESRPDLDPFDSRWSPLEAAAAAGALSLCNRLLEAGCCPWSHFAPAFAAYHGHADVAVALWGLADSHSTASEEAEALLRPAALAMLAAGAAYGCSLGTLEVRRGAGGGLDGGAGWEQAVPAVVRAGGQLDARYMCGGGGRMSWGEERCRGVGPVLGTRSSAQALLALQDALPLQLIPALPQRLLHEAALSPQPCWRRKVNWLLAAGFRPGPSPLGREAAAPLPAAPAELSGADLAARLAWLAGRGFVLGPPTAAWLLTALGDEQPALEYLLDHAAVLTVPADARRLALLACARGRLRCLALLRERGGLAPSVVPLHELFAAAAQHGRKDVGSWLAEALCCVCCAALCAPPAAATASGAGAGPARPAVASPRHALTARVFAEAAGLGSVPLLEALRAAGCPWSSATWVRAAQAGCGAALAWLVEQGCPRPVSDVRDGVPASRSCCPTLCRRCCCCARAPSAPAPTHRATLTRLSSLAFPGRPRRLRRAPPRGRPGHAAGPARRRRARLAVAARRRRRRGLTRRRAAAARVAVGGALRRRRGLARRAGGPAGRAARAQAIPG